MNEFFVEHAVREQLRALAAQDLQLTRWRWFQRNEHGSRERGWRVRVGEAPIRLGYRLQNRERVQPAGTAGQA